MTALSIMPAFDDLARRAAPLLPRWALRRCLQVVSRHDDVALCLHRVGGIGAVPALPSPTTIPASVLDDLIDLASGVRTGRRWLTLSFDDGYVDAVTYVGTRGPRHPEIDWRLFVCPDKAARRVGFRWDAGMDPASPLPATLVALSAEHRRQSLAAAGVDPTAALADPEELASVAALVPGVLGNHTDHHLPLAKLVPAVADAELRGSLRHFEELFGSCRSFAVPFGSPGHHWSPEHATQLFDAGVQEVWSVQSRTSPRRDAGGNLGTQERTVRPRFPIDGRDDARTILTIVVARAALQRVRRPARPAAVVSPPRQAHGYRAGEQLVELHRAVVGPEVAPVVIVHGASGHVETFRALAGELGDRPVFGLRARGVLEGEAPGADLDSVVDDAVDAIKQLGQPVELMGYSLGGLLALQIAAVLQPVGLLAAPVSLIDTYHPDLELLPLGRRVRHAAAFGGRHGYRLLVPWARRLVERQLRTVLRRPRRTPAWYGTLGFCDAAELGLVDLEAQHRSLVGDLSALVPFEGPVRVVRSLDLAPNLPEDAGIVRLVPEVVGHAFVRGDHFSMLSPALAGRLAAALARG